MHRAPSSLAAIKEATAALQCQLQLDDQTGALVRTLAGCKIGGVFLQLGSGAPEAGAWLLDGMDITSKLIIVVDEPQLSPVINNTLGNDIRVAIHAQDTREFLDDIRAHQLHVVLFDHPPSDPEVVRDVIKLLAPGALLMILATEALGDIHELLRRQDSLLSIRVEGSMLLASRRAETAKLARRGARRMRRRHAAQQTEGM